MKHTIAFTLLLTVLISSSVFAQTNDMKSMEMKNMKMEKMDMQKKCMNMKDMSDPKCKDMMNDQDTKMMTHTAIAIVKEVDLVNGKVTLAHEQIKSLNWPAMTMGFAVKDKMLFDKLIVNQKVNIKFRKDGADYLVIAVK